MDPQNRGGLGADRALSSPTAGSCWSCRPRGASRPETSKISGRRKLPPISTSCPRETITSRPAARARSASTVAPALLLTALAAWAPVSSLSKAATPASAPPRVPPARSNSRLQ